MNSTRKVEDYTDIAGKAVIDELHSLAGHAGKKRIVMINSTKKGGGVAELLHSLMPCLQSLGVDIEWLEFQGDEGFFSVTKTFHNVLQGEPCPKVHEFIERYKDFYSSRMEGLNQHVLKALAEADIVVIHDPQPMALIKYKKPNQKWVWRCHIDLGDPNPALWEFISGLSKGYDRLVVSRDIFVRGNPEDYVLMPPSIDPLAEKNRDISSEEIKQMFEKYDIPAEKPFIAQVSRFDKWKDPVGVIEAFRKVRDRGVDCSLILLGNFAKDDPEGTEMYERVLKARNGKYMEDIHVRTRQEPLLVNALQKSARIILQKSLREGFALTVSEALWKETPVIGSDIGGIPLQVRHGRNGRLVEGYMFDEQGNPLNHDEKERHLEAVAGHICELVHSPEKLGSMGKFAKEHVKENFLITRHLYDYLKLFISLQES